LAGLPVTGEWRLSVRDLAPRDTGTLRSWSLRIDLE
jgi:subtilisin-like proprotein convertase family protein